MFGINDLDDDEVVVKSEVTDKTSEKRNIIEEAVAVTDAVTIPVSAATITNVELTLAQTLAELKSARPKIKGVVMQEANESTQQYLYNSITGSRVKIGLQGENLKKLEEATLLGDIQAKKDADYHWLKDLGHKNFKS
ncbi:hypothetical protein Tco_0763358 [Tanacetum coccineum]